MQVVKFQTQIIFRCLLDNNITKKSWPFKYLFTTALLFIIQFSYSKHNCLFHIHFVNRYVFQILQIRNTIKPVSA